ncbi:MAG: hypothetical protein GY720_00225 [bacterium]|nr:hypothetical protein [bacterium]
MSSQSVRRLALLGAMLFVLAACGGDGTSTAPTLPTVNAAEAGGSTTTTTTEAIAPEEAFQQYSECMREHGIEMPDPTSGGDGTISLSGDSFGVEALDFEALEEAAAACDSILEDAFGEFEMTPEQQAEMRDRELAFAKCLRDNDIDWPDPTGDVSGAAAIAIPDNIDPETLEAAMEVCSKDVLGGDGGFLSTNTP